MGCDSQRPRLYGNKHHNPFLSSIKKIVLERFSHHHRYPDTPNHLSKMESIVIQDAPTVPASLLTLLHEHLPYSLTLLRRLQFAASFPGGSSPTSHILLAYHSETQPPSPSPQHFTAAYYDPSLFPDTQCWLYTTAEDTFPSPYHSEKEPSPTATDEAPPTPVLAILRRIRHIAASFPSLSSESSSESGATPATTVVLGSLHDNLRAQLLVVGARMTKTGNAGKATTAIEPYGKWLLPVAGLPVLKGQEGVLPVPGLRWDKVRRADLGLIRERSTIRRFE
jgi:hypothetical protein